MFLMALCILQYDIAWETDTSILFLLMLLTNTRSHTRNKISASAEAGIDKDVRRDIAVGKGGGMQRRRWRQRKEQGATS